MITLQEYNRRFDLIINAFRVGYFTPSEASDAMRELTSVRIDHHIRRTYEATR
jgi:hypothetical protein